MNLLRIFERGLAWFRGLGKADGSSLVPAISEKQNSAQSRNGFTQGAAFGVSADESIDATANRDAGTITDTKMDTSSDAIAKGSGKPRENTATVSASASMQEASFEQDQEQIMRLGAGDFVSSRIHALSPHSKSRKSNPTTPAQEVIVGLGALQAGDINLAHQQLGHALRSGEVDRVFLAKVLIGSVGTHLGRAALFADKADDAQRLLEQGLRLGVPGGASRSVDLMMVEAERCARLGKDIEAIQRWQDIASLLGENTPEHVYRQLSEAYARNQQSFGGTAEENRVWGDCHKHDVLEWFHQKLQPKLYLEIGVDEGLSLVRATGSSIGIDPRPELKLKVDLPTQARILPVSSDAFFRDQAVHMLHPKPGLVFIDGMHLFEFALRDFINVEKYASPSTLVVIDDIYPTHQAQGSRRRKSGSWTGDIWKLHRILKEARPDLTLVTLNSYSTGLLLIAGLDPEKRTLEDEYQYWVDRYADDEPPPMNVISRNGAIPSGHQIVAELIDTLKQSQENNWSVKQTREALSNLTPKIKATEEEHWGRAESLSGFCDLENAFTAIGECHGSTEFQVFFPQSQEPTYRQECSKKLRLPCNGKWVTLKVDIPRDCDLTNQPLRIDPFGRRGRIEIQNIKLIDLGNSGAHYESVQFVELGGIFSVNDLELVSKDPCLIMDSCSFDPHFHLQLSSSRGGQRCLVVSVRISAL